MVVGAGMPLGRAVALGFAAAGAQVIVVDHQEAPLMDIAGHDPTRIEGLCLDLRRSAARARFADIWDDYPLDVLIDLHALRHADRPWDALRLMGAVATRFAGALRAGDGALIMAMDRDPWQADALSKASHEAIAGLVPALWAGGPSRGIRPNMLVCAPDAPLSVVVDAAMVLAGPQARGIAGAVIPVGPPSD